MTAPDRMATRMPEARDEGDAGTQERATAALRDRMIAEMSSDTIGFCDLEGRWRQVSPGCRALFGREPAQLLGRSVWDYVHPDFHPALRELLRGEAPQRPCMLRVLPFEGGGRWAEAQSRAILDERGAVSELCLALRDVTTRRAAEEALRYAEQRLHQVMNGLPEAIAVLRRGKLLWVNPANSRYLGYDGAEDLVGKRLADLVHPEDRDAVAGLVGGATSGLREIRFVHRGGEVLTAEVAVQAIEFDGNAATLLSARDVTERKRLQSRLLQADRMVSVGTLAAGVAHEINNPLACVIANLDCATEHLGLVSQDTRALFQAAEPAEAPISAGNRLVEMQEMLRDAREGAERVRHIVRDLRTLSRGDDDHCGPTDVRRVLESSINMVWNEIRHRARLVKDYGETPAVEANEARLGQLFVNLLINAAQAIPEGQADRHEIRIRTYVAAPGRLAIEVRDTGSGIPPEIRSRIFDPFFTTKPIGVGTGLGLSICHSIVTALGGEIGVESEVGVGSTFRVLLKTSQTRPSPRRRTLTPILAPRRARILVVDDEPMIGTLVRRTIGQDHEVLAVTSADEALALLRGGERFDIILCDLMMPVMTGMDLHAEIERMDGSLVERMIFITGGAFTPRAREFIDKVPNQHIEKPFDVRQLRALVRDRLRQPLLADTFFGD